MKKFNLGALSVMALLIFASNSAFAQSETFTLENGKAINQCSFVFQGRTSTDIYKEVQRWFVKYYIDPEDNIKARIDSEYLRGVGYHAGFLKNGASTASDMQYTFIIEFKESGVQFTITDVVIVHDSSQDVNSVYRLEEYFVPSKKKKKDLEGERMLAAVNKFSNSLFESFQTSVFPANAKL